MDGMKQKFDTPLILDIKIKINFLNEYEYEIVNIVISNREKIMKEGEEGWVCIKERKKRRTKL